MSEQQYPEGAAELTRRSFASAGAGDFDAMMTFIGPDSVWDVSPWGLGTYTGAAAIRAFFGDWIGAFDEFSVEIEQLIDLGNGVIVAIATQSARSSRMQGYMRLHQASVFVWRNGLAAHVVHYRDVDSALAAAELAAASARADTERAGRRSA
jgi:ketosteroid isomerase-like protein